MQYCLLGAVATLAAVGHAFLLPPTISSPDSDIINTLRFEDALEIDERLLAIPCPGCPVAIPDVQGQTQSLDTASMLRLNFSISHTDIDKMLLNGAQIYPMDLQSQLSMEPLTGDLMIKTPENMWAYVSSPKLGYSLSIHHPAHSEQDRLNLVTVHLEILEVADKFVGGIPSVDLKLVETSSGKLMIGDVDASSPTSTVDPTENAKECTSMLCKWRAIMADRLSKFKGCGGKDRSTFASRPPGPRPHGLGRPRPHGPYRPHRHHHKHHGFAPFLRSMILHIFIPIVIGIVAGITASLVGMAVGHFAVFLWRTFYRRGQMPRYAKIPQELYLVSVAEDSGDDESKSFIALQGPPPIYEEVVFEEKSEE